MYEEWQSLPEETENVVLVKRPSSIRRNLSRIYVPRQRTTTFDQRVISSVRSARCSRRLCFYLEQEALIQQLLNQRYDMQQLMTESEWMTQTFEQNRQEMVLLENEWSWSPERPPQLYDNETVQKWRQQQVAYTQALQKDKNRKHSWLLKLKIWKTS